VGHDAEVAVVLNFIIAGHGARSLKLVSYQR
jgi:hypothetical protein